MSRTGVFGGTFDPVHTGHLIVAQDVACSLSLDRVFFVPALRPPHKLSRAMSPPEDRLGMLRVALKNNPGFSPSDVEIKRGGVSYTVDTIRELSAADSGQELFFILGLDNLLEIGSWKEPDELVRLCTLVAITRPGFEAREIPAELRGKIEKVDVTAVDISSRSIRDRVRKGLPIRYLVPEGVEQYIDSRGLYR